MKLNDAFPAPKDKESLLAPFIVHKIWANDFITALKNEGPEVTEENQSRVAHLCRVIGKWCAVHLAEPEIGRKISGIQAELEAAQKSRPKLAVFTFDERALGKGGLDGLERTVFL